jgi:hypothetical protein
MASTVPPWLDEDPQVAEFLRRYQLSQEQERALKMQKLSDFGFGMMGARKGQELQAVGRAGLLAGEGYRRNRESAQQENMSRLQMTQYVQRMAEQERARAEQMRAQKENEAYRSRIGQALQPQAAPDPGLPAMAPGGPTPQNLGLVQQARASAPPAGDPEVAALRAAGMEAFKAGKVDEAKAFFAEAKAREEGDMYDTTPRIGTGADGPYNYLVNKRGNERRLGAAPPPDNQVVQLGDRAQVIDKLRAPAGTSLAYGQSPDSVASTATARRGQDLVNARARDTNKIMSDEVRVAGGKGAFEAENKLRDEFTKATRSFVDIRDAHQRVLASAQDPSGAGDMSLIFSYMRALDPSSTVREGEYANAQNAGSVPDHIRGLYNKALNGKFLSPEVRADFVKRSGMLYAKAEEGFLRQQQTSSELAKRYNLRPENVVADLRAPSAPVTAVAPSGPNPYSSMSDEEIRRRLTQ